VTGAAGDVGAIGRNLTALLLAKWGGPVSTDGLELAISIFDEFSSFPCCTAGRSAAQAAEGSE
jgi:hypothetical protein